MSSARLIAAVSLFLIIVRGQARPVASSALQNGPYAKETTDETVYPTETELEKPIDTYTQTATDNLTSDTSKVSADNKQTLSSEAFTGGDSENTVTSHTTKTHEVQSFIGSTIPQDEISSNDSDSNQTLSGIPEEKLENELTSTDSHNNKDLHSLHHSTPTIVSSPFPDLDVASSSEDKNTDSAEDSFNTSNKLQTAELNTLSTLVMQEHTSEDKYDEDLNIQHTSTADVDIHTNDVTKSVKASPVPATPGTTQVSPNDTQPSPFISHEGHTSDSKKLPTTEKPNDVHLSHGADISERLGYNSTHEEVLTSRNIEIDAEGTEGRSSSKGPTTSSHQSDWLVTAVTVAVAMDGIVKAFSSSSPSLKNATSSIVPLSASSLSEGQLPDSSFVDPSISKSTPSSTSSLLSSLFPSSAELPDSSFVETTLFKDQSSSLTSPSSVQGTTVRSVSSSVDTTMLKDPLSVTSTPDSFQVSKEVSHPVETAISKDSSFSVTLSASTSPQESIEEPINFFKNGSSTLKQEKFPSIPEPSQFPASFTADTKISNDLDSLTPPSASLLPQESAQLPTSSMADTMSESTHALEEIPVSSLTENNNLKNSAPSSLLRLTQTPEETAASSSGDAAASSSLTSTLHLSHASDEVPTPFFADTMVLENSPSSPHLLTPSASHLPLSSFSHGPESNANSLDNAPLVTSSFEMLPMVNEGTRDTADLLKFADMGDDMDVAETMIFRPIYSYRQDSARRRLFRSLADQR